MAKPDLHPRTRACPNLSVAVLRWSFLRTQILIPWRTSLSLQPVFQASAPCTATNNANLITISAYGVKATVQPLPPMNYPRAFHNSVVLPDGKVLIMGGQVLSARCCTVHCSLLYSACIQATLDLVPLSVVMVAHGQQSRNVAL